MSRGRVQLCDVTCEIPERQPGGFLSCQVVNSKEKKGERM